MARNNEGLIETRLKTELETKYPLWKYLKGNAMQLAGIPDRIAIFNGGVCAFFEVKATENDCLVSQKHQPNQKYYIDEICSNGGFARYIYAENFDTVLEELNEFLLEKGVL